MQSNIKSLVDKSNQLNNLLNDAYKKDFNFKNQKSQQQIQSLESQKDLIEKSIEDSQEKQRRFSNVLGKYINSKKNLQQQKNHSSKNKRFC
ncbi:Uncharacterised protein [Mycoplasmopsis citelli]|uniref:Uncharacterized protein n=1 Tax=Mycoplasmopsis citelli TaxID=171281 RepID=A0A449B241_9BACT|nr:hypothetical protein [Mycoplasmopsis citelli]VEU74653.1 Uncharacterised protein [Mycoplasmopsis citelli]